MSIAEAANCYAKWTWIYIGVLVFYFLLSIILYSMKFLLFFIYALLGIALPLLIIVVATGVYEIVHSKLCSVRHIFVYILVCLSCVSVFGGVGFVMAYEETCGIPCPRDCPPWIPVPNFNHNAIFHLFAMASLVASGFWGHFYCKELEPGLI